MKKKKKNKKSNYKLLASFGITLRSTFAIAN